jgi:hypothetical protein
VLLVFRDRYSGLEAISSSGLSSRNWTSGHSYPGGIWPLQVENLAGLWKCFLSFGTVSLYLIHVNAIIHRYLVLIP